MIKLGVLRLTKYLVPIVALVPVAFGISVGVDKLTPESAKAALSAASTNRAAQAGSGNTSSSRLALIVGNADYPDAGAPLAHPVKDTQALADELRRGGFEVEVQENLGRDEMKRAFASFNSRIRPGSVALVAYAGFGIQVGRQSYMIPVNAQIWKEPDVRRDGVGIDAVLADLHKSGASVKLAIFDASRRNPFERRFRGYSAGLGAIDAPSGTLLLSAAAPGKVAYDVEGPHGLLIGELLKEVNAQGVSAETVFNRTRVGVSRSSNGEQVPLVSSSLIENFAFAPDVPRRADSRQPDSRQADSRRAGSRQPDSRQADSRQADSRQADSRQADSRQADSRQADSRQADAVDSPARPRLNAKGGEASSAPVADGAEVPARPEKAVTTPKAPQYELASQPVARPAAKDSKAAHVGGDAKPSRRTINDVSREIGREHPRAIIRRGGWNSSSFRGNRNWRVAGAYPHAYPHAYPQHVFSSPALGFRY